MNVSPDTLPRITLVTPNLNGARFLEQTIKSVVSQNYPDLEYIIVDGGSTDASSEIITKYEKRITHWICESDRGQSHAVNKGHSMATGEIFGWLNSDDCLEAGALRFVGAYFRDNPGTKWLIGGCRWASAEGPSDSQFWPEECYLPRLLAFWKVRHLPQPSSFWRRTLVDPPLLREDLTYVMDYELWVRMSRYVAPALVPRILAQYRWHDEAKTVANIDATRRELLAAMRSHWRARGALARMRYELGWRHFQSNRLLESSFAQEDAGNRSQAASTMRAAALHYPERIFAPRTLFRLLRLHFFH